MTGSLTKVGTDSLRHCDCSGGWINTNYHYTFHVWLVICRRLANDLTEAKLGELNILAKFGMQT